MHAERLVVLRAYIDESGNEGGTRVFCVAGYVSCQNNVTALRRVGVAFWMPTAFVNYT